MLTKSLKAAEHNDPWAERGAWRNTREIKIDIKIKISYE